MSHLMRYLNTIENPKIREAILTSTKDFEIKSTYQSLVNKHYINYLLLGNVQSGKTAHALGVISNLADKDIKLFFYLTTDNSDLQKQTYDRIQSALQDFNVLSEHEFHSFDEAVRTNNPVIIVLKKNSRILKKWYTFLNNKVYLKSYQSYIIDDEADAASLNTYKNKNNGKISPINETLSKIKALTNQCFFIQLTATPQAILLQDYQSDWKADIVQYFPPGDGYVGGNYIYTEPPSFVVKFIDSQSSNDNDLLESESGLKEAVLTYLVTCAEFSLSNKNNCNFMIHPSHKTDAHNLFELALREFLNLMAYSINYEDFEEIQDNIFNVWEDLKHTKPDIHHFEDIIDEVKRLIELEMFEIVILNSKTNGDCNSSVEKKISNGFNIIIGGNIISRGLTIPKLQTVYYCRSSKTPNADTFWQHSRIFGYDRNPSLIRLFMPKLIYKFFVDLNDANNSLIEQALSENCNYQFYYPEHIRPTRLNVLSKNLFLIKGGKNYFPNLPDENNLKPINKVIDTIQNLYMAEQEGVFCIAKEEALDLLHSLGNFNSIDWNKEKFITSIEALSSKRPKTKIFLIIRENRKISKGTGTLLSPDDRKLTMSFKDDIVIVLYQINGKAAKGWKGENFWLPNIKLPSNLIFWDSLV